MQVTYILLKIEHKDPIPHLTDHAAGRVETMSRVELVTASVARPCFMEEDWYWVAGDEMSPKAVPNGA